MAYAIYVSFKLLKVHAAFRFNVLGSEVQGFRLK
jgi:hypothetical protein